MKKIKLLIVLVILGAFTTSCTKEDQMSSNEVQNKNVLSFASEEEMHAKIVEIEAFKKNQEEQIMQKLLQRNNLESPTLEDFKNASKKELTEADKARVLEDVKFYHQEKLKAIFAERAHFGFTSIQSIADEINSLKALNPTNKTLIERYKNFITEKKFLYTSNYRNGYANIINANGVVLLKNKNISDSIKESKEKTDASNRIININSGYLASGYNDFIVITYSNNCNMETGKEQTGPVIFGNGSGSYTYYTYYKPSTMISCFVNSPNGYVLYPCHFSINPGSHTTFTILGTPYFLGIKNSGYGTFLFSEMGEFSLQINHYPTSTGSISGIFAIPIAGTSEFLWVSGSKNF